MVAVELVTLVVLVALEDLAEVVMELVVQAMGQLDLLTLEVAVELEVIMVQQTHTEMEEQADQE